jgi:hypothetical protein
MAEKEGVIKFQLDHSYEDIGKDVDITNINAWRSIMHRLGLIGQAPGRYDGFGFGNISQKPSKGESHFFISGTQSGQLQNLCRKNYCMIEEADPFKNSIKSRGYSKPSSETLTHAAIYLQSPDIQCIIHAHCPDIWKQTKALNIPHTAENIEYGTPEMAFAVGQLFQRATGFPKKPILTTLGHKDGVFTFGSTMQQAALEMIKHLALALTLDQANISG